MTDTDLREKIEDILDNLEIDNEPGAGGWISSVSKQLVTNELVELLQVLVDEEIRKQLKHDPVLFFIINIKNFLTKEQQKILSDRLVELTTKSNGEVLMEAIKKSR